MKQEYTRQELADIRELELDQWFDTKYDSEFKEDYSRLSASEKYDIETKEMVSWKLFHNKIEINNSTGITSIIYLTNPDNNFIAQMIVNLHKDKELK